MILIVLLLLCAGVFFVKVLVEAWFEVRLVGGVEYALVQTVLCGAALLVLAHLLSDAWAHL